MKRRLIVALAALAISFALPTYAQQKDLADPQTTQKLLALGRTYEEHTTTTMPPLMPRDSRATPFLLRQEGQSLVGKPFRNGMQTFTSGGTRKTLKARRTGMPFT